MNIPLHSCIHVHVISILLIYPQITGHDLLDRDFYQGIRRENSRRFFPTLVGGPGTGGIPAENQQYRELPKAIPQKNGLP